MQRVTQWIFDRSPRQLAIYLVVCPLLLLLIHTVLSIVDRNLPSTAQGVGNVLSFFIYLIVLLWSVLLAIWLLWLRGVVLGMNDNDLGLPKKWFRLAFLALIAYLLFMIGLSFVDLIPEQHRHIFYALSETVAFIGLFLAYPITCHYAARGVVAKRSNAATTWGKAIPVTLLLIFGTVLAIPYLHRYFSTKNSESPRLIPIYVVAVGLCMLLFVIGFVAAVAGWV